MRMEPTTKSNELKSKSKSKGKGIRGSLFFWSKKMDLIQSKLINKKKDQNRYFSDLILY